MLGLKLFCLLKDCLQNQHDRRLGGAQGEMGRAEPTGDQGQRCVFKGAVAGRMGAMARALHTRATRGSFVFRGRLKRAGVPWLLEGNFHAAI